MTDQTESEKDKAQAQQNYQDIASKGARAELLQNELGAAIDELRQRTLETFASSAIHDAEGHLTCRVYLDVLDKVKGLLAYKIEHGKVAQTQIETIKLN